MAIAKFEIYQEVLENIQADIAHQTPDFTTSATEQYQAEFVLAYMSKQNSDLIAALKKMQEDRYAPLYRLETREENSADFTQSMNRAVPIVRNCIELKSEYQNKFFKRLAIYLVASSLLTAIICIATSALVGAVLAFALKLASIIMLVGFSFGMGIEIQHYLRGPGYRFPKLDANIIKNWEDSALISRIDNGINMTVEASSLKSQFSNQTFFGQNKTLATLVEEKYQLKMAI